MKVPHRFAQRSLNPLDENGQEGCAQCGLPRGSHPEDAPLVSPVPDVPVFSAARFERLRQSYELKVADLARETLENSRLRTALSQVCDTFIIDRAHQIALAALRARAESSEGKGHDE